MATISTNIACLSFLCYRTVLLLLKMVVEYCQCVDDIPAVAPDLLTRLVDLLKVSFLREVDTPPEISCIHTRKTGFVTFFA